MKKTRAALAALLLCAAPLAAQSRAELEKVHPAAKDISLGQAAKLEPVQLHEGSQRALKALGG